MEDIGEAGECISTEIKERQSREVGQHDVLQVVVSEVDHCEKWGAVEDHTHGEVVGIEINTDEVGVLLSKVDWIGEGVEPNVDVLDGLAEWG